jgi:transposase
MIPSGVQIFVAIAPIDLRYSFDRLSGLAKEQVGYEPRSSALFVFFGRRRDALKVLFFDGSGLCIFYKRLDRGTFAMPRIAEGATHLEIDESALEALLDGIEVTGRSSVH